MQLTPQPAPQPTPILLNGERLETAARTLAELVAGQGFAATSVATAVNGAFVPREARAATLLSGGDKVEIVAPRQGG
ncbi:MAG TPA: sulfur carrier protein ThiS [Hyphomicrobiaceae bacterium]|nr:sulfur carrier protein ThiS [Hyphomicrobiaceae bacterium]